MSRASFHPVPTPQAPVAASVNADIKVASDDGVCRCFLTGNTCCCNQLQHASPPKASSAVVAEQARFTAAVSVSPESKSPSAAADQALHTLSSSISPLHQNTAASKRPLSPRTAASPLDGVIAAAEQATVTAAAEHVHGSPGVGKARADTNTARSQVVAAAAAAVQQQQQYRRLQAEYDAAMDQWKHAEGADQSVAARLRVQAASQAMQAGSQTCAAPAAAKVLCLTVGCLT